MPLGIEDYEIASSPRLEPVVPRGRTVSAWRRFAIGLDFGLHACRAVLVDTHDGEEAAEASYAYAGGVEGIHRDPHDPKVARHDPQQYVRDTVLTLRELVRSTGVEPHQVVGIGVAAIGSAPMPVDSVGVPLGIREEYEGRLDAMVRLPEDRTAEAEAREIAELAARRGAPGMSCGGFWSGILRLARTDPELFAAAHGWIEATDLIPAVLTGNFAAPIRSLVAARLAMFDPERGGLPSPEFLAELDPRLAELRERLYETALPSDRIAGVLTDGYARSTGLGRGVPIAVGTLRAASAAIGAGVRAGRLVRTTTGHAAIVAPRGRASSPEVVPDALGSGRSGVEVGTTSIEHLLHWFARDLAPNAFESPWRVLDATVRRLACGASGEHEFSEEELTILNRIAMRRRHHRDEDAPSYDRVDEAIDALWPGESGLLALDWNGSDASLLDDPLLSGLIIGHSLTTTAPEILRALIEATAFGTKRIVERIEAGGILVREVVLAGEAAHQVPAIAGIYADVLDRPVKVARAWCPEAVGAAVFSAVVGGAHRDLATAATKMAGTTGKTHRPDPNRAAIYRRLDGLYVQLHTAFGTREGETDLGNVMKDLLMIRDEVRTRKRADP